MEKPKIIYLQVGEDVEEVEDIFDATWCVDCIFSTDIEYRLADPIMQDMRSYQATIKQLQAELDRIKNGIKKKPSITPA